MSSVEDNSKLNGIQEAQDAHRQLQQTLGLLSRRLDYPARIDAAVAEGKENITRARRRNPLVFVAGVTAVSLLAGAAVAAVALAATRRFN